MLRIITYTISESAEGLRIELFLRRHLYSHMDLSYLKRIPGSVLLNDYPAKLKDILHFGDVLKIHVLEESSSPNVQPSFHPLSILYEDEDLIVLNKPAGMPTHSSRQNVDNSLASALAYYYQEQGIPFVFRCSNRLDQDTSGVIAVARHRISGSILSTMSERRMIHREYLAITAGIVTPSEGTISAPIGEKKNGSQYMRTIDFQHGQHAVTHYKVLETTGNKSLVSLKLETGRTHQIRVHMKYLGFPLLGDYLYHPGSSSIGRQALHSYRVSLPHPITGEEMSFTAPLPEDMKSLVNYISRNS
ncbi:MAG: RluA family pseudouridine synthase [Eubacteriales bacterium]|nr:RluA family pseudouridine synthase [Eubacteriales bacterium]